MAGIIGKRPFEGGQTTKSGLSGGCRTRFLPLVVGLAYNRINIESYLGNVGLID